MESSELDDNSISFPELLFSFARANSPTVANPRGRQHMAFGIDLDCSEVERSPLPADLQKFRVARCINKTLRIVLESGRKYFVIIGDRWAHDFAICNV
jgi:hypothetical protein